MPLISPDSRARLKSRYPQLEVLYRSYKSTTIARFMAERKLMREHDVEVQHYKDRFTYHGEYISTNGSDKWIIEEIFKQKTGGFFVECGADTGAKKSNTFILEQFYKWSGICIEPNPVYFKKLQRARSCICLDDCVDGKEGEVEFLCYKTTGGIVAQDTDNDTKTASKKLHRCDRSSKIVRMKTKTLGQLLKECSAPNIIDFLVLDVEGAETRIMESVPFDEYRFLTMVIERSTSKLKNYFLRNGYKSAKTGCTDIFFIHESLELDALSQ